MKKSITLRISIFTFLSTMICIIGNYILQLRTLSLICQGLGFISYLFFLIWVSQLIYERVKWSINVITIFLSFALAVYSLALFSLLPYEKIFEYYVLFFYLFSLICLISTIVIVGRIVFYMPKKTISQNTEFDEIDDAMIVETEDNN